MKNFLFSPVRSKVSIAVLSACLAIGQAHASTSTNAENPVELDEIVVSGSRAATKLSETPLAIGVVKEAELERDKPKTMGDIINRIAGVYWNDLGNEQHSMAIRQPISTNAMYQYLEDGIPIRPLGVFNHNSLNEMNMAGTSSVEVVKGPASSLYGSNAVGGAVNFLTAAPSKGLSGSFGVRHDDKNGFTRYDTMVSNSWGDLGVRFAHYSSRRDGNNWQEYSYGDKDSFTLRTDYRLSSTSKLRATLVHTYLDSAMTGSLFEDDYRKNPGKSLNTFTYRKDKTTRANIAWEGETLPNGISTITVFARQNDHGQIPSYTISNCSGTSCRGTLNNNHLESLGFDLKHEQYFGWLDSRLIAGYYYDSTNNPYYSDNLNIVRDPVTGKRLSYTVANASRPRGVRDYEADILNRAAFAQWEFSPFDKTRVVVGGRHDSIKYDYRNKLAPAGSDDFGAPNEVRTFSKFSPKVGATYSLTRAASLYTNLSQGFTPPEVSQLYGKTGIPDLKPAVFTNFEIGTRIAFLNGALKLDAAVYELKGKDTIVSYTISPGISENRNAGRTTSRGLELGMTYDAGGQFDARFGTTIASHKFDQYEASGTLDYSGKEMPGAPNHITSMEVGYKPMAGARIALEVVRLGSYWMNNANTVNYDGHTLINLRGSYKFARGWEAWIQGRNLGNEKYALSASSSYSGVGTYTANTQNQYSPGEPRSLMVGLMYSFGKR